MAEGGGGRGADARLDGRLEFLGARRVAGCALADAGLDGFFKASLGRGGGCWYAGRVRGGMWTEVLYAPCETEKGLRGPGGVRPKYWVPRERIRTRPVMCLANSLVQVLYAFL